MLLHQPAGNYVSGYKILEKGYKEGKIKAIGLSNFSESQIQEILDVCEVKPTIIQVECHPYFPQTSLRKFVEKEGILLQAWFPLGHGDKTLIEQPIFEELSKKYNKSKVQIILRWHIQMNNIVIPGASKEEHIKQNIDIFDFELTDEDLEKMQKLDTGTRFFTMSEEEQERAFTGFAPDFNNQK